MIAALTNHLWQSTLFAGAAWLLTLMLRNNRAQTRHLVWLAASIKFFVPFSILVAIGGRWGWHGVPMLPQPELAVLIEEASQPIVAPIMSSPVAAAIKPGFEPTRIIGIVWACGILAVFCSWLVRWVRIRSVLGSSSPLRLDFPAPARTSTSLMEPGVFGILHPVLLLPEGITKRLTPEELRAILTHELSHIRRRDNLTAFIQTLVESIFWFHPLVWWIGARLVDERERACDEEVLRLGAEPEVYAEGILNVCKLYVQSPPACISGVTGSNLKTRIEAIMSDRIALELNLPAKVAFCVLGTAVLGLPVILGILNVPVIRAQEVADWQTAAGPEKAFEVASVKPNDRGGRALVQALPGRLVMTNFSLRRLMLTAYGIQDYQLIGGPTWADSEHYDIEGKAGGTTSVQEMEGPMLQALLESRFRLILHRETKQLPIYELTIAKGGAKLTPSKEGSCVPYQTDTPPPAVSPGGARTNYCGFGGGANGSNRTLDGTGVSIAQLATNLSRTYNSNLGRNVMDGTGLSGLFDLHLKWTIDDLTAASVTSDGLADNQTGASLSTALQEQLGLKLVSVKGPVEVLVIDHVELPSAN